MLISSIILLITLGIFLLLLEFLVVPGVTISGIGGILLLGVAIWLAYTNFEPVYGHLTVLSTLVFSTIGFAVALKSKTWNRLMLKTKIEGKASESINKAKVKIGDTGTTITRLAPMGKVQINEELYEASSENEYIDENSEVVVVHILNRKLIVKLKDL